MDGGRIRKLEESKFERAKYRQKIDEHQREFNDNRDGDAVARAIDSANREFRNMEFLTGRETVKDAQFVRSIATRVRQNADNVTFNRKLFATHEYAINLAKLMDPSLMATASITLSEWKSLGTRCQHKFQRPVHVQFIQFSKALKPDKVTRVRNSAAKKKKSLPTTLKKTKLESIDMSAPKNEENLLQMKLKRIEETLSKSFKENKYRPIHYFRFVLVPNSFEASVRNIFHMSFLIQNRKAVIFIDADQQRLLYPKREEKRLNGIELAGCTDVGNWIVSINKAKWRELVEEFAVKKAMVT